MEQQIRAWKCQRFAGFDASGGKRETISPLREVLDLTETFLPRCDENSVLIRNHFVGVQYPDALQAQGFYQERPELPYVPGVDCVGKVLKVGASVTQVHPGDIVIGNMPIGALAEVSAASATRVWKLPAGLDMQKCANLSRNYFSAYHSLRVLGAVKPGQIVLVDGASGGVGLAAIQLAKAMGAKVIAGVSVEAKTRLPERAGADSVLVYGREQTTFLEFKKQVRQVCSELGQPAGVDVIVDMVQGELFETALLSCLRPLGRVALVGFTAGQKPIRPGMILIKQATLMGSMWGPWSRANPEQHKQHVEEILDFMASGKVDPIVGKVFDFEDAISAFELYERNEGQGNTVIRFPQN
ncbi:MAG: NADPH:quinone oxidoreductase family protein [Planctomycetota bacterium]|nr:NADPH:quinone oxidoreductase family protein [Planctomycetota bacterium]